MKRLIVLLLISFIFIFFFHQKVLFFVQKNFIPSDSALVFYSNSIHIPTPIPTPVDLNADNLFQLVNTWRIENNYQPFIKSEFACNVANTRLLEIQTNFSHDGFYYKRFCQDCWIGENLAQGFYYSGDEKILLNDWISSPLHLENLQSSFTHSCIKCENGYCAHIFANF